MIYQPPRSMSDDRLYMIYKQPCSGWAVFFYDNNVLVGSVYHAPLPLLVTPIIGFDGKPVYDIAMYFAILDGRSFIDTGVLP